MANVIISDSTNASYDGKLSTASGFYRVEAHNLGFDSTTTLALPQTIAVTFANAGNCKGLMVGVATHAANDRGVQVDLREIKGTATLPVASPGIVTFATHGFTGNEPVSFTTTGTLPTGVVSDTVYYVEYIDANTFYLNAVAGSGVRINFTGTSSGTHTLRAIRATVTKTATEIMGSTTGVAVGVGHFITPFKFATPYAVDTTASKWDFRVVQSGGTTGTTYLTTSNASAHSYATWCDTKVTATDDDTMIVADSVVIDKSITLAGVTPTGVTSYCCCGVICANPDDTIDNVALLTWENPAVASYTLTLKGQFIGATHSGVRIGTSTNPIKITEQAKIVSATATSGSASSCFFLDTNDRYCVGPSFFAYGEIPTLTDTTLDADANSLQKVIVTVDDMSSVWAANDYICIGKQDTKGAGDTTEHQIDTIVGKTITLKANLTTKRLAGASVFIYKRGIQSSSSTTTERPLVTAFYPYNFTLKGVEFVSTYANMSSNNSYTSYFNKAQTSQFVFEDNTSRALGTTAITLFYTNMVPPLGISCQRNFSFKQAVLGSLYAFYTSNFSSGDVTIKDNISVSISTNTYSVAQGTTNVKLDYENNRYENGAGICRFTEGGLFPVVKNNYWYGINNGANGVYYIGQSIGADSQNNIVDRCGSAIVFGPYTQIGCINKNMSFGPTVANTTDVIFGLGAYTDYELNSPSGALTIDTTDLPNTIDGTHFKITDYNDVVNDDKGYLTYGYFQRTGTGLTDTTVHTAGGFAMRFESTSGTDSLRWAQDVPTSNIQNKTMTINVWCKINNVAYYGGTDYQMPRLTINYDNGTTTYVAAIATTDWQLLSLSFTPTTTYGKVTATLSTMTDATGSNAYVYWDDVSVLYPPGVQLNLGNIDLWANGLPVMPTIATNLSAADVWSVQTSGLTGTGTIGKLLSKVLTISKFLGLK